MKRMSKALAGILVLVFLLSIIPAPAMAYSESQLNTADALFHLGLFLGTGTTYALDENLTREQGIILLVRMLGAEKTAMDSNAKHPFTDVSDWASPYVGYAYREGITNGTGKTTFSGTLAMTDQMFLTLCIRAIGYSDLGWKHDFSYDDVWSFAASLGLIDSTAHNQNFTRGETVEIFWRLLNLRVKNNRKTLADKLIGQGVFTRAQWNEAVTIQAEGRDPNEDDTGEQTVVPPTIPTPPPVVTPKPTATPTPSPVPTDSRSDIETPRF